MKVLLVSVFKESVIGGVSIHSSNLRDRLIAAGHDVATVDFYAALDPNNGAFAKAQAIASMVRAVLAKAEKGYTLVHIHASNKAIPYYLLAKRLKRLGCTVVLSLHSGLGYFTWLDTHKWFARLNDRYFPLLDQLLFMNEAESQRARERYPYLKSRVSTINPFVAPEVGSLREQPTPAPPPLRVVTVGAFIPRYATEETIQACQKLVEQSGKPVDLTLIESSAYAQPAYREQLEQRAQDASAATNGKLSCTFVIDTQDVLSVMHGHHAFVRPARGDSYGLCVAEALLLGIPSIATDVCQRCAKAARYAPGDIEALTAWLAARYDDPSIAAHSLLDEHEDSFFQYQQLYRSLTEHATSA